MAVSGLNPMPLIKTACRSSSRILATLIRLMSDGDSARDAFQEGMLAAWKSLATFKGNAALSTWVHRVVVNHALMRMRRRARANAGALPRPSRDCGR